MCLQRVMGSMVAPVVLAMLLLLLNPVSGSKITGRLVPTASSEGGEPDDVVDTAPPNVPGNTDGDEITIAQVGAANCRRPDSEGLDLADELYKEEFYGLGEEIEVKCTGGYAPTYTPMECKPEGTGYAWDVAQPCIKKCKQPDSKSIKLSFELDKSFYDLGEEIHVTCVEGYWPTQSVMKCIQSAIEYTWDTSLPCVRQCNMPVTQGTRLSFQPSQKWYNPGQRVAVTCSRGYRPSTSETVCQRIEQSSDSDWDTEVTCIQQCQKPNTNYNRLTFDPSQQRYDQGQTVMLSCPSGYRPSTPAIMCKESDKTFGQWNQTATCIQQCSKPGMQDPHLSLKPSQDWYDHEDTVTVTCSEGYQPRSSQITCQGNSNTAEGQWSEIATCIQRCSKPDMQYPLLSLKPLQPWYDREDTVMVTCSEGYQPKSPAITCKEISYTTRSQWSDAATCIQQCINPSTWDSRVTVYNPKQWYNLQETVQVRCSDQYVPSASHITCTKSAQSSGSEWNVKLKCIRAEQKSLQKTADSLSLRVTCGGGDCRTYWSTSVAARPDTPCCGGACPPVSWCAIDYHSGVDETATCSALRPFTWYTLTLYGTRRDNPRSTITLQSTRVRTGATAPDAPEADGIMGKDGTIRWKKLSDCKGTIKGYQLNITAWRQLNKTFQEVKHTTVNFSVTEYTVMRSGTNYTVTVQGFNEAGLGAPSHWAFVTKIKAPLFLPVLNTRENNVSANTFVLPLPPVTDLHGPISEYQIIVSRQGHSSDDICGMGGLAPYNNSLDQEAYIAAALPAHNLSREFVVGDGTTQHGYFNAPLSMNNSYTAFLRVISIWNMETTQSCAMYGSTFTDETRIEAGSSFAVFNSVQVAQIGGLLLSAIVISLYFRTGKKDSVDLESG